MCFISPINDFQSDVFAHPDVYCCTINRTSLRSMTSLVSSFGIQNCAYLRIRKSFNVRPPLSANNNARRSMSPLCAGSKVTQVSTSPSKLMEDEMASVAPKNQLSNSLSSSFLPGPSESTLEEVEYTNSNQDMKLPHSNPSLNR